MIWYEDLVKNWKSLTEKQFWENLQFHRPVRAGRVKYLDRLNLSQDSLACRYVKLFWKFNNEIGAPQFSCSSYILNSFNSIIEFLWGKNDKVGILDIVHKISSPAFSRITSNEITERETIGILMKPVLSFLVLMLFSNVE